MWAKIDIFRVSIETSLDPVYIRDYIRSKLNLATPRKLIIFNPLNEVTSTNMPSNLSTR